MSSYKLRKEKTRLKRSVLSDLRSPPNKKWVRRWAPDIAIELLALWLSYLRDDRKIALIVLFLLEFEYPKVFYSILFYCLLSCGSTNMLRNLTKRQEKVDALYQPAKKAADEG